MTQSETILEHNRICDELHQCAHEENRFLRQHQRVPGPEFLQRKATLLERLDRSLTALREVPAASVRNPDTRALLESTRARILQVLQLDKENEQLLLRCSLTATRPASGAPAPAPSASMLQKIYARCS